MIAHGTAIAKIVADGRAFLAVVFVARAAGDRGRRGRSDLYYTLTSVALLSIASAGVWLTFYIGRINIGQGAYALIGGYVSAILVVELRRARSG